MLGTVVVAALMLVPNLFQKSRIENPVRSRTAAWNQDRHKPTIRCNYDSIQGTSKSE